MPLDLEKMAREFLETTLGVDIKATLGQFKGSIIELTKFARLVQEATMAEEQLPCGCITGNTKQIKRWCTKHGL